MTPEHAEEQQRCAEDRCGSNDESHVHHLTLGPNANHRQAEDRFGVSLADPTEGERVEGGPDRRASASRRIRHAPTPRGVVRGICVRTGPSVCVDELPRTGLLPSDRYDGPACNVTSSRSDRAAPWETAPLRGAERPSATALGNSVSSVTANAFEARFAATPTTTHSRATPKGPRRQSSGRADSAARGPKSTQTGPRVKAAMRATASAHEHERRSSWWNSWTANALQTRTTPGEE